MRLPRRQRVPGGSYGSNSDRSWTTEEEEKVSEIWGYFFLNTILVELVHPWPGPKAAAWPAFPSPKWALTLLGEGAFLRLNCCLCPGGKSCSGLVATFGVSILAPLPCGFCYFISLGIGVTGWGCFLTVHKEKQARTGLDKGMTGEFSHWTNFVWGWSFLFLLSLNFVT